MSAAGANTVLSGHCNIYVHAQVYVSADLHVHVHVSQYPVMNIGYRRSGRFWLDVKYIRKLLVQMLLNTETH